MAIVYYAQAKYPEALKLHEDVLAIRVAELGLEHPHVAAAHYNIACTHSLAGAIEQALASLEQAVQAGFRDKGHIESDSDLDNIRDHKQFEQVLRQM